MMRKKNDPKSWAVHAELHWMKLMNMADGYMFLLKLHTHNNFHLKVTFYCFFWQQQCLFLVSICALVNKPGNNSNSNNDTESNNRPSIWQKSWIPHQHNV